MSGAENTAGGRFEPEHRSNGGGGLVVAGRCDECNVDTGRPRRHVKVLSGALRGMRGMRGMVCRACIDKRKVAAT